MSISVRRLYTNESIRSDNGRVELMYGPFYCLESIDNRNSQKMQNTNSEENI
ncbi:hypothetical protein [Maribellus comscasis]|uniref:hypothetical protein n=1 Tax=Maribellus comscasis TaxID=2681766 RepID=UPI003CCD5523